MLTPNMNYANLKDSYLFFNIAKKTKAYLEEHSEIEKRYRLGIGDVSLPLCDAVITALHARLTTSAESTPLTARPECDSDFLEKRCRHYRTASGLIFADDEFSFPARKRRSGPIIRFYLIKAAAQLIEPAYPAYV
jgi:LL-diaminopimelate aminotransferase